MADLRGQHLRPVVLVVLDGWGEAPSNEEGNAIARAGLEVLPRLHAADPHALLAASGGAVGLPDGIMGNSEVGHLTIGSGRIMKQDLVRITAACEDGTIAQLPALQEAFDAVRSGSGRLHYFGLCSSAGVHSDLSHLRTLVQAAERAGVGRQFVHGFTDGRDTPPDSGKGFVAELETFLEGVEGAGVGTVMGRYWAMDRDSRWERTERAYAALVRGEGKRATSGVAAMAASYEQGVSDEFVEPVIVDEQARIQPGDGVIFFNFRADRTRQLTAALTQEDFDAFPVGDRPQLATYLCMTEYRSDFGLPVLFRRCHPEQVLGEIFAEAGWEQMRLAETEKYAHVTYFLNGGREEPVGREERVLVPSPRVATYDLAPAMSAEALTEHALAWIGRGGARLLVVNFANADMVGHTGKLEATMEACRMVDRCLGRVVEAVDAADGVLLITADHGNAETMMDERGAPMTAHTTLPVPVLLHDSAGATVLRLHDGGLQDVAPTLLTLAGLPIPEQMTGKSLVEKA